MKRFFLATCSVALLVSTPLMATADIVLAQCKSGAGCECALSAATVDDMALILGMNEAPAAPADVGQATLVIDYSSNTAFWSNQSRTRIQQVYGGSGDCPIKLFPEEELVPRDGTWRWRTLGESTTGCPAILAAGLAAGREETLAQNVVWGGSFHPQRFSDNLPTPEMGEMSVYEWRKLGPRRWISDNLKSRECEDGTCVDFALTLSMNLVAENRVSGILTTRSRVEGAEAAILAQFGMSDCRVRLRYVIDHVGP